MIELKPETLRAARGIMKWSIEALAKEAGVAPSTVYLIEKGRPARKATTESIVAAFKRHDVELFGGEEPGARKRKPWKGGK